jgi:sugar fermentation stimulation protein A
MLYTYPPLIPGKLVQRYKRFFADIQLDSGEIVTAHCPNTGPMVGVCEIGSPVQISSSNDPKRKLAYTWEMIYVDDHWVGINTMLPNKLIKLALEQRLLPELGNYSDIKTEVKYGQDGRSRIDFVLAGTEKLIYVEVKNTTYTVGDTALFPDTATTRGQKHLQELIDIMPEAQGVMLYLINRGDKHKFAAGDAKDPLYGQLLRKAVQQGLIVLPCRFQVTPTGITYLGTAEFLATADH